MCPSHSRGRPCMHTMLRAAEPRACLYVRRVCFCSLRRAAGGRALLESMDEPTASMPLLEAPPQQQLLLPPPPARADGSAVSRLLDSIMPSSNSNVKQAQSASQRSVQALLMSANALPLPKQDAKLRGAAPAPLPRAADVARPALHEESMQLVRSDALKSQSSVPAAAVARVNAVSADDLAIALQVCDCMFVRVHLMSPR